MDITQQVQWLRRGTVEVFREEELAQRLADAAKARRPLRVKLGMDPTAPDIHLGHTVVLRKLRQFQDLGHKAILIIGDYTARIGDPTGQNTTRPMLSPEQIQANARTYFDQAGKILDMSPDKVEVRFNSEWLADLRLADIIRLTAPMTVAPTLQRATFQLRHQKGDPTGTQLRAKTPATRNKPIKRTTSRRRPPNRMSLASPHRRRNTKPLTWAIPKTSPATTGEYWWTSTRNTVKYVRRMNCEAVKTVWMPLTIITSVRPSK